MFKLKETKVDVLICGSGSAGTSAAIAAAECGASVRVIDKNSFFGGTLVSGMTGGFCGIYAAKATPDEIPELTLGGIGRRIIDAMDACGGLSQMSVTPMFNTRRYNSCMLQLVYDKMVMASGARPLLHSYIIDAEAKDGYIEYVEIANKSGRERIYPKFVVDATGDADIVHMTGGKYRKNVAELQPASFNFQVAGVNAVDYTIPNLPQLEKEIAAIKAKIGSLGFSREDPMFLQSPDYNKETICCFSRITVDATDTEALTAAEIAGRAEVLPTLDFIKEHFPAFSNAHVSALPSHIGVRETRVIEGEDIITREDVVSARLREDGIGRCGWPVERHIIGKAKSELIPVSGGKYYHIPLGAMIPTGYKNMLVAGRAVSSDRSANASVRVFGPCSEMGQAAGTAAYLFLKNGCKSIYDLDVAALRETLVSNGVLI